MVLAIWGGSGSFSPYYWEIWSIQQVLNNDHVHPHLPRGRSDVLLERNQRCKQCLRLGTELPLSDQLSFQEGDENLANSNLKCSHRILDPCCIFPARESCREASCCTNQPNTNQPSGQVLDCIQVPAEHRMWLWICCPNSGNMPSSSGSSWAQLNCYQHQHRRLWQNASFPWKRQIYWNHILTRP